MKSLLITFFWVMLGCLLIFSAVFFSVGDASGNNLLRNSSLLLMLGLIALLFILLPGYLTFRTIKDWGKNEPKTKKQKYFRNANNGAGLFMLTNIIMGFYGFAHSDKIADLSLLYDPLFQLGGLVSFSFLLWSSYNLAKSKGQSGLLAALTLLYPIGYIILLFLPSKHKK